MTTEKGLDEVPPKEEALRLLEERKRVHIRGDQTSGGAGFERGRVRKNCQLMRAGPGQRAGLKVPAQTRNMRAYGLAGLFYILFNYIIQ